MFADITFLDISAVLLLAALVFAMFPSTAFGAHKGPPKTPWESIAGDREKTYEVIVPSNFYEYEVTMGGSVDGVMTRMPISYSAYYQGWQPNRFLRIENIGTTDVVNPWIIVNGKRNWRTLKDIADEAIAGCTNEREKARAIWEFQRNHRFHACTWDGEEVFARLTDAKGLRGSGKWEVGSKGRTYLNLPPFAFRLSPSSTARVPRWALRCRGVL